MRSKSNIKEKNKKLSGTAKLYIIFTAAVLALCAAFLIYCAAVVKEYDREQPERRVEEEIAAIRECAGAGKAEERLAVDPVYSRYSGKSKEEFIKDLNALVSSGELGYKVDTGAASGLERIFYLTVGERPFAKAYVSGENERTKLFFFTMADWKLDSVELLPLDGGKELSLYIPEGVVCTVNGVTVDETPVKTENGVPFHVLKNLPAEVAVEYKKADGSVVSYSTVDGVIVPDVYSYAVTLPEDVTVLVDGKAIEGTEADGAGKAYEVKSMTKPDVLLRDPFGATFVFDGSTVPIKRFTLELPDNYILKAGGHVYRRERYPHSAHPDNDELRQYDPNVRLHDIVTYGVTSFDENDKTVTLTNNLGVDEERTVKYGYRFAFTGQSGAAEVPAEILKDVDPLDFGVAWSLYMTNDREFSAIAKYYLKGSRYYKNAEAWLYSVDRRFTSYHDTPIIVGKRVSDFVRYSDNCFSVRVYVDKTMFIHRTSETIHDITDLFVYFIKYDPTPDNGIDDAKWIVAAQTDAKGVKDDGNKE